MSLVVDVLAAVMVFGFALYGAREAGYRLARWRSTAPEGWAGVRVLARRRPPWWWPTRRLRVELGVMARSPLIASVARNRIDMADGAWLHRSRFAVAVSTRGGEPRDVGQATAWHLHDPTGQLVHGSAGGPPAIWHTAAAAVSDYLAASILTNLEAS